MKTPIERELEKIQDEALESIASAWHEVRHAGGKLKGNARLTADDMRGNFQTIRDLAAHPLADKLFRYHLVLACTETAAILVARVKMALKKEKGDAVDKDDPPAAPDPFASLRKRKSSK